MSALRQGSARGTALAQVAQLVATTDRDQRAPAASEARWRVLARCRRGAVSVEYLMVVAVVGLSLAVTLVALGPELVLGWAATRHVLYGRAP